MNAHGHITVWFPAEARTQHTGKGAVAHARCARTSTVASSVAHECELQRVGEEEE